MHLNRETYSYSGYQSLLIYRWQRTVFWFAKKEGSKYDMYFAKPTPKTVWLPGKPRKKYYRRIFAKLHNQISDSKTKYGFCTLTYHTSKYSQKSSFILLKYHLKEFIRLIRKKYPTLQYFWVIELTKRLYPHIHIVFNQYVHWIVIRAIWYRITKSYITDIRSIPAGDISNYICSYLTQQKKSNEAQWGTIFKNVDRLYGSSLHFFVKAPISDRDQEWFLISMSTHCFLQDWELLRKDKEKDFWLIPHHFAAGLLYDDSLDHIKWFNDFPDIYASFYNEYTIQELKLNSKWFDYHCRSVSGNDIIPF